MGWLREGFEEGGNEQANDHDLGAARVRDVFGGVGRMCVVRGCPGRWFDGGNADDVGGRFGCHRNSYYHTYHKYIVNVR